jgi:NAD(P)-dependent dehydrogenase (short-subunit alcohol dehydrogenase family)
VPLHILVTGATRGLGLATVRALIGQGHCVILHGRDERQGRAVLAQLNAERPAHPPQLLLADFRSLAEVRELARACIACAPRLDVLINNAGGAFFSRQLTRDGFEATFAVNHLAPFLLTKLLLPRLEASTPARIVNVASAAHRGQALDFDDLMSAHEYKVMRAYGRSKLANILFTRALARRLAGQAVTANALHPGVVNTRIGQNNLFARLIGRVLMPVIGISPEEGARTSVFLATAAEVAGTSGGYFARCEPRQLATAPEAVADEVCDRLWNVSEALVAPFAGAASDSTQAGTRA